MATSTSSLNLLCDKILFRQLSVLVAKDCKSALLEVFPQPMFFLRLLDLIASSEWFLWSSKLCVAMAFAGVPFSYRRFSVFLKLRWTTNNRKKKTIRDLFDVILFSLCRLGSNYSPIILPVIFLDIN